MPAPIPAPEPNEERQPGPERQGGFADGLPAGLDYQALLDAMAASGMLDCDEDDAEAQFADQEAAAAEGRLLPADPAQLAAVTVEHMPPGPAQAGWLGVAAAGAGRLDEHALTGVAVASAQLASWAQAAGLAAVGQLAVRTAEADRRIGLRADGRPARVSRDAVGQIEMALRLSHYGAEERADLAVTLSWRLPATGAALAAGRIDLDRAELIANATSVLSEDLARQVEELILPKAGQDTVAKLRERLHYAVIAVDPEGAEQRRGQAERNAEMRLYADDDQTATLLLSKLPQIEAAASFNRVTALARARIAAGMAGTLNFHRCQVALGLLLGTLPPTPPADRAPPDQPSPDDHADPQDDHADPDGDPGPGWPGPGPAAGHGPGDGLPADSRPVPSDGDPRNDPPAPRDEDAPSDDGSGGGPPCAGPGAKADDGDPTDYEPGDGQPVGGAWDDLPVPPDEDAPPDDGLDNLAGGDESWDPAEDDADPFGTAPVPAWPALGAIPPTLARRDSARRTGGQPAPGLLDALLPWTTLAGIAEGPGTLGRIGPITPAQARQLARVAEHDPAAQWRMIVTNTLGQAIAVARIPRRRRPARGRDSPGLARDGPPRPGSGLVGRITVTITQDTLAATPQAPRRGPPAQIAAAALRTASRALDRAMTQAAADAMVGGCAHQGASAAYRPPPRLRELVTARDVTCRNPVCGQPAWRADLDHTIAWAPDGTGGPTCECNLGGRCRRDHILKQHRRWTFTQAGGMFRWTAPSGRTYTVDPDTHPV